MAQVESQQLRRASMQDYRSFPLYLSQEIWDALADRKMSQVSRVDRFVRHLVNNLGMRHPTEPSMAVIASLVGQQDNLTIPQLLTLLQTVKSVLKTTVTRAGHSGIPLPAGRYLELLPNQVAELPSDVAEAMALGGFAAPPMSVDLNVVWQTASPFLCGTHIARCSCRGSWGISRTRWPCRAFRILAWQVCKWHRRLQFLPLPWVGRRQSGSLMRYCRICKFLETRK